PVTPPTKRQADLLKPPTQQAPFAPKTQPAPPRPQSERAPRQASESQRARAVEPLKAPTDPYVSKTPPQQTPATKGYAPPSGNANDSPEAVEANTLLSTVRAVGLSGEALGTF